MRIAIENYASCLLLSGSDSLACRSSVLDLPILFFAPVRKQKPSASCTVNSHEFFASCFRGPTMSQYFSVLVRKRFTQRQLPPRHFLFNDPLPLSSSLLLNSCPRAHSNTARHPPNDLRHLPQSNAPIENRYPTHPTRVSSLLYQNIATPAIHPTHP